MLRSLCHSLMVSAAGRHLAIDLVAAHGDRAGAVLETMLRENRDVGTPRAILNKARRVLKRLH
jgi:hypothetical protein